MGNEGEAYDGWIQINDNGFGNRRNRYAWSMEVFAPPPSRTPRLYVGTTSDFDGPPRPEIWSRVLEDGDDEEWHLELRGTHRGFRKMKVFNDRLYVGTLKDPPFFRHLLFFFRNWGCQIYRYDGRAWIPVINDGFGTRCHSVRSMEVYRNQLYVGTSNLLRGGQVWRTKEGAVAPQDQNDWEQCGASGFGKGVQNTGIFSLKVFEDCLWAGTANGVSGCEIWKYDGGTWHNVISGGFISRCNVAAMNLEVFKGHLYVDTYNPHGGCQLWRYPADTPLGWENVMVGGFYNPSNVYIWSLRTYEDKGVPHLYAGTFIGVELKEGAELWRSRTGNCNEWERVVSNGFNDPCNYGIRNLVVHRGRLFAGTARPPKVLTISRQFEKERRRTHGVCGPGCEVWQYPKGEP